MRGMSDKTATVLLILVLGGTMLLCLCYLAIFVVPEAPFNPYPPSYATARIQATLQARAPVAPPSVTEATPTPTSLFGPTWTPSVTPTPTN
ncbi:MAG: hypothetical protein D6796_08440, partial [Caldilineae bacterium]